MSEGEKAVSSIVAWAEGIGTGRPRGGAWFVDLNAALTGSEMQAVRSLICWPRAANHCQAPANKTLIQHVGDIRKTINYAHKQGLKVKPLSGGLVQRIQRQSPEYVYELVDRLQNSGIGIHASRHARGDDPDEVFAGVGDMVVRFPGRDFDFHPHNDYGLGTPTHWPAFGQGQCHPLHHQLPGRAGG